MAINFNDTTQPAGFELCTEERKYNVSITAPVGELLQPYTMNEKDFIKEQGWCFQLWVTVQEHVLGRVPKPCKWDFGQNAFFTQELKPFSVHSVKLL